MCLVDVQAGVDPVAFGRAGAGCGGLPGLGDDERAEQPGGLLAERPLGEAGEENPAVEDVGEVEGGLA
ncbi:hypothetical protein HEP87_59685 [Streptomyces sp. S1D4-11]